MNRITRNLAATAFLFAVALPATADQQILDDLIVDGSACIGFDCVNGESFGFDTLRLKENNLRIRAFDTSSTSSFPSRDWQITFNDTSNGGLNKFSIDDIDGARTPFTIEGNAPSHSLYVDDGGRIGLGTNSPVVQLHVKDGNTPTLRLEQDGTSGFTPQTWDVAGNEANFFIRDATSGSTLPFRIFPGAPSNALTIKGSTGDIGIGSTTPEGDLHVRRTAGPATLVLETTAAETAVKWEMKASDSTGRLSIKDLNGSTTPFKVAPTANENLLRVGILSSGTVDINGNLVITGNCFELDGACADYVFEPDYELRPLERLAEFIADNKHLPNVPSAKEIAENGVNMAHMSGRLLEKIEELTLYTLQQQETIEDLTDRLAQMEQHQNAR